MVAVRVGPHVRLPSPGDTGEGSLNLLVAIEGESGEGKQRAKGPAGRFVAGPSVPPKKPGTGQGIASLFSEGTRDGVVQIADTAWLNETEITNMGAHTDMKGNNLVSTLLAMFMGESLGEHYADRQKRREVAEHAYRVALTVGVQPTNAGVLLGHQSSGLSQRFLWVPALWDAAVLRGRLRPPAPGPDLPPWEPWPAVLPASLDPELETAPAWSPSGALKTEKKDAPEPVPVKPTLLIQFAQPVWREIDQEDQQRQVRLADRRKRGEFGGDPDSHGVLCRLTVAAHLAIWLDGTTNVSEEIWALTNPIMLVSAATRVRAETGSKHQGRQQTAARHRDALALEEKKRDAADQAQDAKAVKAKINVVGRVMTYLAKADDTDGWVSSSELARCCGGRDRPTLGGVPGVRDLLATLADVGQLQRRPAANNAGGDQYRLPR